MNKLILLLITSILSFAQVGVGTNTPHSSAILDVESSDSGFLPPRLASDADVSDPAEGLLIFDESDNCLNVYDGSRWVNLCECSDDGTSNSGGLSPLALDGESPLRFKNVDASTNTKHNALKNRISHVTGVTLDGNAYAWGDDISLTRIFSTVDDTSTTNSSTAAAGDVSSLTTFDTSYTPIHVSDPVFNGKVKQYVTEQGLELILTDDGDLYGFGTPHGNILGQPDLPNQLGYIKNRKLDIPSNSGGIKEIKIVDSSRQLAFVALGNDGNVYWKGDNSGMNPFSAIGSDPGVQNNWTAYAKPNGVSSDFKYTKILNPVSDGNESLVILQGSDDNVYINGRSPSGLVNTNGTPVSGLPSSPAGIAKLTFPAGTGKMKVARVGSRNGARIVFIAEDGQAYGYGSARSSSGTVLNFEVEDAFSGSETTVGAFINYLSPTPLKIPNGENGFLDVALYEDESLWVTESNKLYSLTGSNSNDFNSFMGLNDQNGSYMRIRVANSFEPAMLTSHTVFQGSRSFIATTGQFFSFGENRAGNTAAHGMDVIGGFYTNTGASNTYGPVRTPLDSPVPMPLLDGQLDTTNNRPRP